MGRRLVLVADDYDHAAAIVAESLALVGGFETMVATNGRDALDQGLARCPVAAVLDIDMPGIGGIEVAQRLREAFGERRPLLIAVTGGPVEVAVMSGMFDHVLKKPFDFDGLLQLLEQA